MTCVAVYERVWCWSPVSFASFGAYCAPLYFSRRTRTPPQTTWRRSRMRINSALNWRTPAGLALVVATLLLFPGSSTFSQTKEPTRPKFDLPDFSGNVRFTRDWGYFQAAGMIRRIKWVDTTNDQFDLGGTEVGAGLNLTSNLKFTPNDTGRFAFVFVP